MIIDPDGMDWYQDENGKAQYNKDVTKDNFGSSGLKGTYIGKSGNEASKDGYQYKLNEDGTKTPRDVTTITDTKISTDKTNNASVSIPVAVLFGHALKEFAGEIAVVYLEALAFVPLVFILSGDTRQKTDEFAQHGKNDGRLDPKELAELLAKKESGTLTNQEKMKLKKHEKNIDQRANRQSKDNKKK